jgi:fumarylacetoacetase
MLDDHPMHYPINDTHDPKLKSWVESANDPATDFPIQNLPLCSFILSEDGDPNLGVAIGDSVVDVATLIEAELLKDAAPPEALEAMYESGSAAAVGMLSLEERAAFRAAVQAFLRDGSPGGQNGRRVREKAVIERSDVRFIEPHLIEGYTDFYASIHHATTVGSMFRPDAPLLPNYKWVPIGYHGRASSITASGAEVRRPRGQTKADDAPGSPMTPPTFGPCKMLDYELEVGAFIARPNDLGAPVAIGEAESHLFGLCLVNDWSARDIQKWEYQPLGPFLAKNFATSISPFVVTMEALAPFRSAAYKRPDGDPAPLPYLASGQNEKAGGFDITLEVHLLSKQMREKNIAPIRLSRGSFREMYWTFAQMLAHHTSNGCNLQTGDLIASGTVSGPEPGSRGCMLELTWQGRDGTGKPLPRKPIELPTGEKRTFLEDGDEVIFRAWCEREGRRRIGFGECRGVITPAIS